MLKRKTRIDRILCYYFQKLVSTSIKTSIKIDYYFQIIVIFTGKYFTSQEIIGRWLETSKARKRNILAQKFKNTEISIGTSNFQKFSKLSDASVTIDVSFFNNMRLLATAVAIAIKKCCIHRLPLLRDTVGVWRLNLSIHRSNIHRGDLRWVLRQYLSNSDIFHFVPQDVQYIVQS